MVKGSQSDTLTDFFMVRKTEEKKRKEGGWGCRSWGKLKKKYEDKRTFNFPCLFNSTGVRGER